MKKSKKVALCGVMTALAVVIMLAAYFPYLTFALPALAGAVFCVVMIEIGTKWAFGGFVTAAILSVLFCEKESAMMFTCFFGFYPILKSYYEKIRSRAVEYIVKFATFTACVALAYFVIIKLFGIPMEGMGDFGKYTPLILLAMGEVMFFAYDLALTQLVTVYMKGMHKRVLKLLK